MKTLIISGASGYLGQRFLSKYGKVFKIIALCRNTSKLEKYRDNENIMLLNNEEFLSDYNDKFEDSILLNLAFPRTSEVEQLINSFDFTTSLYKKVYKLGNRHIINISSQSVYDKNRKIAAKETDLTRPFDLYGIAKMYIESHTETFCENTSCEYINIRLGSIIGPNFNQRFINKLIDAYLNDKNITIKENEYQYSYLNAEDAIDGFYNIVLSDRLIWNKKYNLGSNFRYTISEVMKQIALISQHKYKGVINVENIEQRKETNEVEIDFLTNQLDWKPRYDHIESIKQILREQFKESII